MSEPPHKQRCIDETMRTSHYMWFHVLKNVELDDVTLARVGEAFWPLRILVCKKLLDRASNSRQSSIILLMLVNNGFFGLFRQFVLEAKSIDKSMVFLQLSGSGDLDSLKWVHGKLHFGAQHMYAYTARAFSEACFHGRTHIIQWMHTIHRVDFVYARAAFVQTCVAGHLELAKWLHQQFNFQKKDVFYDNCAILRLSCSCKNTNQLEIVQWLYNTFHYTADDIHANESEMVRVARITGHLDVARWLHDTFLT